MKKTHDKFSFLANFATATIVAVVVAQFFSSCSSAKFSAEKPVWLTDRNAAFPEREYLAFVGTGENTDEAKLSAVSNLSYYFKTSIDAQTEALRKLELPENTSKETVHEAFYSEQKVALSTGLEIAGIEYSDVYHDKNAQTKTEKYKCVAFINRKKAATDYYAKAKEYLAQTDAFCTSAILFSSSPLVALGYWQNAYECGNEFLEALQFLQLVEGSGRYAENFAQDRLRVAGILPKLLNTVKECTFFVKTSGDWQQIIQTSMTKIFSQKYRIVEDENKAAYFIDVRIIDNKLQDGKYVVLYPSVEIAVIDKSTLQTVYTNLLAHGRTSAFSENTAYRTAYKKLSDELEIYLMENFQSHLTGEIK